MSTNPIWANRTVPDLLITLLLRLQSEAA